MPEKSGHHSVPGAGPGTEPGTPDGQRALSLHAGIAVAATVLSVFVTVVFVVLDQPVLAVVFAVVALASIAALVWAVRVRRNAAP